jgi:hypothetical protein
VHFHGIDRSTFAGELAEGNGRAERRNNGRRPNDAYHHETIAAGNSYRHSGGDQLPLAENNYMLDISNAQRHRYLKIIHYENRSPWFPGSVVFGIGVGENKAVAGGA